MVKKNCLIVLGSTGNMSYALAITLMALKKHSPNLADDIIVYEQNFSEKDKQLINKIMPVKFINYIFPVKTDKDYIIEFSNLTFARYECFDLLDEYKNVLWLDIDILIKKDISKLVDFGSQTGIAVLPDEREIVGNNFTAPIDGYIMQTAGINAGILALNERLPQYKTLRQWCYETTDKYKESLRFPDQGILCLMFQEFKFNVTPLPRAYNYHPLFEEADSAVIQHPCGPEKFWNFFDDDEWFNYYNIWLEMGGTPGKIRKLTALQKMLYQKTCTKMNLWYNQSFINYLLSKYDEKTVDEAYKELIRLVLESKIKLNDPRFEMTIKRKYSRIR